MGEAQGQADRQFLESPCQQTFELLARNKANESATLKGQNKMNWFSQDLAMYDMKRTKLGQYTPRSKTKRSELAENLAISKRNVSD
jgi:hypothetical protein